TAAREIEAGVVPVAGKGAVLDAAAIQRKAHMRAAIVERGDTIFFVGDQYRSRRPGDDQTPLRPPLPQATRVERIGGRCVHERPSSAVAFAEAPCSLSI